MYKKEGKVLYIKILYFTVLFINIVIDKENYEKRISYNLVRSGLQIFELVQTTLAFFIEQFRPSTPYRSVKSILFFHLKLMTTVGKKSVKVPGETRSKG